MSDTIHVKMLVNGKVRELTDCTLAQLSLGVEAVGELLDKLNDEIEEMERKDSVSLCHIHWLKNPDELCHKKKCRKGCDGYKLFFAEKQQDKDVKQ